MAFEKEATKMEVEQQRYWRLEIELSSGDLQLFVFGSLLNGVPIFAEKKKFDAL